MKKTAELKNIALQTGWIAVVLVIISLIWILTKPVQAHYLMRTVNRVFIDAGDTRRISNHIDFPGNHGGNKRRPDIMGFWYDMFNSANKMFVFAFFHDGILLPLGAIISDNGTVDEIIPLSAHAKKIYDDLPQNIIYIYINRIENSLKPPQLNTRGQR